MAVATATGDDEPPSVYIRQIFISDHELRAKRGRKPGEARALAESILRQLRDDAGAWNRLQQRYDEDAYSPAIYRVRRIEHDLLTVCEAAHNLEVGSLAICETIYGYHIIKRVK